MGYSERRACRVLGLAHTTYYEHKFHVPSDREIRRLLLTPLIADIHQRSRGTYGMLRIRGALQKEHDMIVNRKLILSIMRELKIQGLPGPKKQKKNLVNVATEDDLVQRNFSANGPEVLWLTDITEHGTAEGKVYCCVVLDLFTRKVVGWAIDRRCESALVNDALAMANASRRSGTSTIIHSDHGSQFTSWGFTENVRNYGLMGSMGTIGDCYDNAPMESFWGSMQIELLNRQKWRTKIELSIAMADYIVHFYNEERRHSSIDYWTPTEFEDLHSKQTQTTFL
ncbi:MAG: IS3 family transposase [Acidimicrobiales bacterium]